MTPSKNQRKRFLHAGNVDIHAKEFETPFGHLQVHGWIAGTMEEARDLALKWFPQADPVGEFVEFAGASSYFKAGHLRPKSAVRHGIRQTFLRARAPRVQEYFNLCWLHNRHFQVPLPLTGGVLLRKGLPRYQFLITREVTHCSTLDKALPDEPRTARMTLAEELGSEVARMHALSFVHHDLYPRNILIMDSSWPRRVVFLDAWAGGDAPHFRSPAYDLACLLLEGCEQFSMEEQVHLLRTYLEARRTQGKPVRSSFLAQVKSERDRLLSWLHRRPERLRGQPMPGGWPDPALFEAVLAD